MTEFEQSVEYCNSLKCTRVYHEKGSSQWPGKLPEGVSLVAPMAANIENSKPYKAMLIRKYGEVVELTSEPKLPQDDSELDTKKVEVVTKKIEEMTFPEYREYVKSVTGQGISATVSRAGIDEILKEFLAKGE